VSNFDILLPINLALALVALVRGRGAMFVIIANVCTTVRAFANIEAFGQPRSQGNLPASLFDPARLDTAASIFGIVTVVAFIAVMIPAQAVDKEADDLPGLPRWLIVLFSAYFVALAFSIKTIFGTAYGGGDRVNYDLPQGGLVTCLQVVVVYAIYRKASKGDWTVGKAFGVLVGFLFVTDYSKGSTGIPGGLLVMALFLFLDRKKASLLTPVKIGGAVLALVLFTLLVRGARTRLASEGATAVGSVSQSIFAAEDSRTENAEGIEGGTNATQYAAHVLECVTLYDSGYSREWRSLYDPIIYTFQPSFIMSWLDKQRAIEPAWELARYFIHGGGILIFGEMYWNGGYPCVAITTALVFFFAYLADTRRQRSFGWLMFYCMYASGLFMGVGYGLNYLFRAGSNSLLVIGCFKLFGKLRRRNSDGEEVVVQSPSKTAWAVPSEQTQ
jgi:hypothetical protein